MTDNQIHRRSPRSLMLRRVVGVGAVSGAILAGGASIASAGTIHGLHSRDHAGSIRQGRTRIPGVFGKVTSVGSGTFTITDRSSKTFTVNVSSSTVYTKDGAQSASFSDVKLDDYVAARGTISGSTVTATRVRVETKDSTRDTPRGPRTRPTAVGKVTSVGTNSFTIKDRKGATLTVTVDNSTTYEERGVTSASIADVKVGDFAAVTGSETGTDVSATDVRVATNLPPRPHGGMGTFGPMHGPRGGADFSSPQ